MSKFQNRNKCPSFSAQGEFDKSDTVVFMGDRGEIMTERLFLLSFWFWTFPNCFLSPAHQQSTCLPCMRPWVLPPALQIQLSVLSVCVFLNLVELLHRRRLLCQSWSTFNYQSGWESPGSKHMLLSTLASLQNVRFVVQVGCYLPIPNPQALEIIATNLQSFL